MHLQGSIKAGTIYIIIILVILFSLGFQIIGGFPTNSRPLPASDKTYTPSGVAGNTEALQNLQLKELLFSSEQQQTTTRTTQKGGTSSTTTPRPTCTPGQDQQIVDAQDGNCGTYAASNNGRITTASGTEEWTDCANSAQQALNLKCVAKPVIYLYPTKPTLATVSLQIPGTITVSIPEYPKNGWQDILAYPDGTLSYQEKTYKELYYETAVKNIKAPEAGIIIPKQDLVQRLTAFTARLGLLPDEQAEFLTYWLPRLQGLRAPYILFSLIDPVEKERIDHVEITPKPDTMIEFLAYFKPLQTAVAPVKPLVLPNPPQRKGFTAVEWGGTIDY